MKATARAAARVDLAGGTLDLWPLYLLHPGSVTINFALELDAVAEAREIPGQRVELASRDLDATEIADSADGLDTEGRLSLLSHLVRHLRPQGGVHLVTSSASPAGAGLGASSALAAAVVAALGALDGSARSPEEIVRIARDCETQALGFPAGSQDYWPGLIGGALALHWGVAGTRVEPIPVPAETIASRFALAYTGAPHHSGFSNWAVYKARLEGEGPVRENLEGVRVAAHDLRGALLEQDWDAAAEAMRREWSHRRLLGPKVSTPQIDALIEDCRNAGALAGKACGAGGGGCVALLCEEGTRPEVEAVFVAHDATAIDVSLAPGLRLETDAV